jgi:N-acetylornithine carbamoyltransferase
MKRFLALADFSREEVLDLLALAQALQDKPDSRALAGKILGLVFFNPSLRTLASFQAGMARLGGSSFVITPGQGTWQLETRLNAIMKGAAAEHIREGIPVLASYCDALGVRAFAEGKNLDSDLGETLFGMIDQLCNKPLINMESAMNHPCQALADWRTLDELNVPTRAKFVLSWVYHPKALPLAVPAATVHMAAMRGMEVVVLRPDGFALPPQIMDNARLAAAAAGGSLTETCRSRGGSRGRERTVRQGVGHHHVLRRHRGGLAAARRALGLVRARAMVRGRIARRQAHALPARAPQCRGRG